MFDIPAVAAAQSAWQTDFFPYLNSRTLPTGPSIDLPSGERAAIEELLNSWYPGTGYNRHFYPCQEALTMLMDDRQVTTKFESWFAKLEQGQLENWRNDHQGRLAYIILGDQLGRIMFRG